MFLKMKASIHQPLNICQAPSKCFLYIMSFSSPKNPLSFIISMRKLKLREIQSTSTATQQEAAELG